MIQSNEPIGTVVALWRYPVKSMQGEELNGVPVGERGILGDRAYAILERATGHIASAKHPRKWSRLFECRASYVAPPQPGTPLPPIWITLPDGALIRSDDPEVDQALSRVLDREVALVSQAPSAPTREANRAPVEVLATQEAIMEEALAPAAPAGTFFDYAALHILTTATLDRLRELYPAGRFEARRFRPNIVIAPTTGGFAEYTWLGRALAAGEETRLRVLDPAPRCVVTTLPQGDLPRDLGILRTLNEHSAAASATLAPGVVLQAVAGVYASALRAGTIRRGDKVWLLPASL
jgi:uncharacterized protein YcbX